MAITGQQPLNIGAENQIAGSDSLYVAFNKIQNNFTTLFTQASPFTTFTGTDGISTTSNTLSGTVTITNTGVTGITAGTGIAISGSTGNVIISATGDGNIGVTSVGITSDTLDVSNTPVVSTGNIVVNLPTLPTDDDFAAGDYTAPTVTVDQYGRITKIANTVGFGTVTSVALSANGPGISITGGPITSNGTIEVTNTGVTSITAGSGIQISGTTGDITIAATPLTTGTVSYVEVTSNSLTVTGSPITNSGTINIELPANSNVTGNFSAANLIATTALISNGTLAVTGNTTLGNAQITLGNGNFTGSFNGVIGNATPNTGAFTSITASGNANVTGNVRANNINGNTVTTPVLTVGNSGYMGFQTTSGNYTAFFTNPSAANVIFVVPGSDGPVYGVLGTNGQANTVGSATLGWKTVVTQYFSVLLRNGTSTTFVPPEVVRRTQSVLQRDGTSFTNVTLF
jgi:hypothetical protein